MRRPGLIALAAAAALLAACADKVDGPLSPTFGEAEASLDRQIIHPGPPSEVPPETSAERGVAAIRRYEADRVIPPANAATSSVVAAPAAAPGAPPGAAPTP